MVEAGLCIGCGACVAGGNGRMAFDRYGQLQPQDAARPKDFEKLCPFSPFAADEDTIAGKRFAAASRRDSRVGHFEAAYVGHVAEGTYRAQGSSGGMVTWVAGELLARGLVDGVAHVAATGPQPDGGFFGYRISRSLEELQAGAKSRYHPIELSGVIDAIRAEPGRYAVVGIPCFIKAVHLLRAADEVLADRIVFTLGLFCGHMKSLRMVESFAWQMGVPLDAVAGLDYRLKIPDRPANWYRAHLMLEDGGTVARDWWHLADGDWGAGFFQNPACNFCDDVTAETADIAFGDAWVEPYASDGNGTNVVIARSPVLNEIVHDGLAQGRLALKPVDAEFVAATQAAGLRHRREGLAYRLTWSRGGIRPIKRVAPDRHGHTLRRKLIYRMRAGIAFWSHRVFWLARLTGQPRLYIAWARAALRLYQALTYSRGRLGRFIDGLGLAGRDG